MTSGAFEGDLVRPLGLVTLHSGYLERELDELVRVLLTPKGGQRVRPTLTVGAKIGRSKTLLLQLELSSIDGLLETLDEARSLFSKRNRLIHGQLFAGGRLESLGQERLVTVAELTKLAEDLHSCKERLAVQRQRVLVPAFAARAK